jgi:hypothetical protein
MNMLIKLDNLLDSFALLKFGDCFLLTQMMATSTARMTDELVTNPTAQSPFFTASIAY